MLTPDLTTPSMLSVLAVTHVCSFAGGALLAAGVAYRFGYRKAPRRVLRVDGVPQVWAQEATVSEPPDLIQRQPGSYARFSWRMLSRRQWAGLLQTTATNALSGDGKPFSRAELEEVRDLLIKRGCAAWRDPEYRNKGWELTPAMGRAIASHIGMAVPHRPPALPVTRVYSQVHAYMHEGKGEK